MLVVVDTNVPVVANNRGDYPTQCVLSCVKQIENITSSGVLAIDDAWQIIGEYMNNLRPSGQPGVGDYFLKWVLNNQANSRLCRKVKVTPIGDSGTDYREFPGDNLRDFDPSDRKFVAVSLAHPDHPPIIQALDSKWWGFRKKFKECGVTVKFLCPADIEAIFARKIKK